MFRPSCVWALLLSLCFGLSATTCPAAPPAAETLFADPAEYEIYQWLLQRSSKKEYVHVGRNDKVEWVGFEGETRYTCSFQFDEDRRVVKATFNSAGFYNDELEKLAGLKKLRELTAWHNFRKGELGKFRDGPNPTSGAGIASFHDGALESINFGGSPFDSDGVAAAVKVPTLKQLIVYHTRVDDEGCRHLAGDDHIEYVRLAPQFSMRISDDCLTHLAQMKALKHLEINETRLTWEGLQHLAELDGQLEKLTFKEDWIDSDDLKKLQQALPKVVIEFAPADEKSVDKMKRTIERQKSAAR